MDVPFAIPLAFVDNRIQLRASDAVWGAVQGWLGFDDLVAFALRSFESEPLLQPLALAYDEPAQVPGLASEALVAVKADERCEKVWAFLAVAFVANRPGVDESRGGDLDVVLAHFGYPVSGYPLLSFVSAEGTATQRLEAALAQLAQEAAEAGPMKRWQSP